MKIENIYMIQVTMVNYMELSSDAELDDCGEQFEEKLREISEELKKIRNVSDVSQEFGESFVESKDKPENWEGYYPEAAIWNIKCFDSDLPVIDVMRIMLEIPDARYMLSCQVEGTYTHLYYR